LRRAICFPAVEQIKGISSGAFPGSITCFDNILRQTCFDNPQRSPATQKSAGPQYQNQRKIPTEHTYDRQEHRLDNHRRRGRGLRRLAICPAPVDSAQLYRVIFGGGWVPVVDDGSISTRRFVRGYRTGTAPGHARNLFQDPQSYLRFRFVVCRRLHPDVGTAHVAADFRDHHSTADLAGRKRSKSSRRKIRRRIPRVSGQHVVLTVLGKPAPLRFEIIQAILALRPLRPLRLESFTAKIAKDAKENRLPANVWL